DEGAVGGVAPAVVGTQELGGVALVVTADLHPAMPAGVEEDVDLARRVPAQDDRLLTHGAGDEIARTRDLAVVSDQEPGAREDALLLLPVDLIADEDLPADDAPLHVDQAPHAPEPSVEHRVSSVRLAEPR